MLVISRVSAWPGGLPTELWEHIITELPPQHLGRCAPVCRLFCGIVASITSRHKTGLQENALVDNGKPDVSLRERLSILRKYHRSWERLSIPDVVCPENSFVVSSESPASSTAHLIPSGWLSMAHQNNGISFGNLPTITGLNAREQPNAGCFLVRQIAGGSLPRHTTYRYDPSQDLLILLEDGPTAMDGDSPVLHVRSMATGAVHPQAEHPTLKINDVIREVDSFRIFEDHCAILLRVEGHGDVRVLYVWNWKTGRLLWTEDDLHGWGDVLSFLGEETLLIVHDDCLQLVTFDERAVASDKTLNFPLFRDDAVQVWNTVSQPYSQAGPGPVFRCDPVSEIVVISMARTLEATPSPPYGHADSTANANSGLSTGRNNANDESSTWSAVLVIELSSLLQLGPRTDAMAELEPTGVPWSYWGPPCARFLQLPDVSEYVAPSTIGRRALLAHYSGGTPMLTVLDFNVGEERVGTPQLATSEGWQTYVAPADVGEDFSAWFENEEQWEQESEMPVRVRSRAINGLPGRMKGAALCERGFVVEVVNKQQTEHILLPFAI